MVLSGLVNFIIPTLRWMFNEPFSRWSETGDYVIIDQARFSKSSAVNKIFKTIQFSSFVRQLNLYGFRKFFPNHKLPGLCTCRCHSTSSICYQHDNFRRGNFSSLVRVTRPRARRQSKSGFLTIEENVDVCLILIIFVCLTP